MSSDIMRKTGKKSGASLARQIAQHIRAYHARVEGHPPEAITVVVHGRTLVISLEGALSSVELSLMQSPSGAAQVQEFHRQLFWKPSSTLWHEISKLLGIEGVEPSGDGPASRACVQAFANGTVIHVFLLDQPAPASSWSGSWTAHPVIRMVV